MKSFEIGVAEIKLCELQKNSNFCNTASLLTVKDHFDMKDVLQENFCYTETFKKIVKDNELLKGLDIKGSAYTCPNFLGRDEFDIEVMEYDPKFDCYSRRTIAKIKGRIRLTI